MCKASSLSCFSHICALLRYRDDEDDLEGSGEEEHLYRENDGGEYNTHRLQEESINVVSIGLRECLVSFCIQDSDEEIDPNEIDMGFHDERSSPPPMVEQATPSSPEPGKLPPTPTEEPHKQPQPGGETNFFAQPGILAGDYGQLIVCHQQTK